MLVLFPRSISHFDLNLFSGPAETEKHKFYLLVLLYMCRLLGTPTDKQWPGVNALRDWHVYPQWQPQNLARAVPALGPDGVDLLEVSFLRVLKAAITLSSEQCSSTL